LCINKHEKRGLDAIISEFSAKRPAVAALAARTAENCRIWMIGGTPCDEYHIQAAYVPVQSRSRVGALSERAEKGRKLTKRCRGRNAVVPQVTSMLERFERMVQHTTTPATEQHAVSSRHKQKTAATRSKSLADLELISLEW